MKLAFLVLGVLACVTGCSGSDETTQPEDLSSGSTHFNFAASKQVGPIGPAYYAQLRPTGSEMADVLCPGPSYTPTERVFDSNGKTFTGDAGSCEGTYGKTTSGEIVIKCATPIQSHTCN